MNGFGPGAALRSRPAYIARTTRRNLLLLWAGALPALLIATPVKADPSGVESGGAPPAATAEGSARAELFNEDPSDPQGREYAGSVTWRLDRINAAGRPDEIIVHADIEIPDLKMKAKLDFKRNTDKSLPASHVIELTFVTSQVVPGGEVNAVPGMLMKLSERGRGIPFAGRAAKIASGFFLIGLSNVEADRARNTQLLKERQWFDIPMVYANQRRGILAIEKGNHGEEIFNEAMMAWERSR